MNNHLEAGFCSKYIGGDWCCSFGCLNWSYCIHFAVKERLAVQV